MHSLVTNCCAIVVGCMLLLVDRHLVLLVPTLISIPTAPTSSTRPTSSTLLPTTLMLSTIPSSAILISRTCPTHRTHLEHRHRVDHQHPTRHSRVDHHHGAEVAAHGSDHRTALVLPMLPLVRSAMLVLLMTCCSTPSAVRLHITHTRSSKQRTTRCCCRLLALTYSRDSSIATVSAQH